MWHHCWLQGNLELCFWTHSTEYRSSGEVPTLLHYFIWAMPSFLSWHVPKGCCPDFTFSLQTYRPKCIVQGTTMHILLCAEYSGTVDTEWSPLDGDTDIVTPFLLRMAFPLCISVLTQSRTHIEGGRHGPRCNPSGAVTIHPLIPELISLAASELSMIEMVHSSKCEPMPPCFASHLCSRR